MRAWLIANYLSEVSEGHLSVESKVALQSMLREISEIESIGDACYNMARAVNRMFKSEDDFNEEQYGRIREIMSLCDTALDQMMNVVEDIPHANPKLTLSLEVGINECRKRLREMNLADINEKKYSYQIGVHYMDLVNGCEKLGDYIVNVVEAHVKHRLAN